MGKTIGSRRKLALVTRCGEKEVLANMAHEAHTRLVQCLDQLKGRTTEPVGGSVWFCYLRDKKAEVEDARVSGKLARHYGAMQKLSLGGVNAAATEAAHARFCCLVFMWLHDLLGHPLRLESVPAIQEDNSGMHEATAASDWMSWASEAANSEDGTFLQAFMQKLALWGRFLAAQFLACGAFGLSDMNAMQMEALGLRQQVAWSVPTEDALTAIGKHAPLVELGAGTGLWSQLLIDKGIDIVSFGLEEWDSKYGTGESGLQEKNRNQVVQTGGPEVLAQHADEHYC